MAKPVSSRRRFLSKEAHRQNPELAASMERRVGASLGARFGTPLEESVQQLRVRRSLKAKDNPKISAETERIMREEVIPHFSSANRLLLHNISLGRVKSGQFEELVRAAAMIFRDNPYLLQPASRVGKLFRRTHDPAKFAEQILSEWIANRQTGYRDIRFNLAPEVRRVKEDAARWNKAVRAARTDPRLQRVLDDAQLRLNDPKRKQLTDFLAKVEALRFPWLNSRVTGSVAEQTVQRRAFLEENLNERFSRPELILLGRFFGAKPLTVSKGEIAKKLSGLIFFYNEGINTFLLSMSSLRRAGVRGLFSPNAAALVALRDFLRAYPLPKKSKPTK